MQNAFAPNPNGATDESLTKSSSGESPLKPEQSRGSFEAKGDSAKTLSLHNGGKTGVENGALSNGTTVAASDR